MCNVVATAGTALTEYHLKALTRLSSNIRLGFDGDKAGLAAAERAIPIAQAVGAELTIVSLPDSAKDPDELIKQDVNLWQEAIDTAQPAVDWLLMQYAARVDLKTAAGKRAYSTAGLQLVRQLQDPVDQDHYVQFMAAQTGASVHALRQKLTVTHDTSEERSLRPIAVAPKDEQKKDAPYQDDILAVLLVDAESRAQLQGDAVKLFDGEARKELIKFLMTDTNSIQDTPDALQKYDTYVKILLLKADARYGQWSDEDRYFEAARLVRLTITEHKQIQKDALTSALRIAEDEGDDSEALRLRQALNELIKEIPRAKR